MNEFYNEYQQKLTTADEAVKCVKSGDWVDYAWNLAVPIELDIALAKRAPELTDVKIKGGLCMHPLAVCDLEDAAAHFTYNSAHCSGVERKHLAPKGNVYYTPIRYSELPYYYDNMAENDVMMIRTCPMDDHGFFNFGPNTSHLAAAAAHSKKIIIEVNENMPRCLGGFDQEIHISQVDAIVESANQPMETVGDADPSDQDIKIAKFIFEELSDGCCLQLGIGKTPNAVGSMIAESDLKDLGVQTEMYVNAFMKLAKAGKITGKNKPFDVGRQSYAFAAGSQEMYDYLDNNPECMAAPVSYTNDIAHLQQIPKFMSINSGINVDLFGQVASETAGLRHISGAGGQQDFVMGAYLSPGGKSFLCIPAVRVGKDGTKTSNIVPTLPTGAIATCTRTNTHFVVTEFGKVNLKGLSTWERAEKLIEIADPSFYDELVAQAEQMGIWRKCNK
ncbi:MAG: butyryl-CoA:acetate CoA-transferase [Eubacterium sp.]|nr:butyryl-CoA:acetate CoA-transferase [Eubacterium sp.]